MLRTATFHNTNTSFSANELLSSVGNSAAFSADTLGPRGDIEWFPMPWTSFAKSSNREFYNSFCSTLYVLRNTSKSDIEPLQEGPLLSLNAVLLPSHGKSYVLFRYLYVPRAPLSLPTL